DAGPPGRLTCRLTSRPTGPLTARGGRRDLPHDQRSGTLGIGTSRSPDQRRDPPGRTGQEITVHIGLVGLGKMGGNMRQRLRKGGVEVTGYDRNPDISDVGSLEDLVAGLPTPRIVWVMVPAGAATDATIDALSELVEADDLIID